MKAFENYHPFCLAIYFLLVIVIAVITNNPVMQIEALIGATMFGIMMQKSSEIISDTVFYVLFFILVGIAVPLFTHNGQTPLFFLNDNPVTFEACICGIFVAVIVVTVILWLKNLTQVMSTDKVLYLFGAIIPRLGLAISIVLRFIPLFIKQKRRVKNTQKAMGLYSSASYLDRARGTLRIISSMITWSIENTSEISTAMKARGYGVKRKCTNYSLFRFEIRDGVILGLSILLMAAVYAARLLGRAQFFYYPYIAQLDVSFMAMALYVFYGLMCILPFIIEIKENLKWKYCISKI